MAEVDGELGKPLIEVYTDYLVAQEAADNTLGDERFQEPLVISELRLGLRVLNAALMKQATDTPPEVSGSTANSLQANISNISPPPGMELLTSNQAAEEAGLSLATIRRWCDRGHIETYRTPGGQRRIPKGAALGALTLQQPED
ncbi:MAG: helix-turn-helix domain-containing protein [Candidatus Saccharimonadales bacterium]